VVRGEPRVRLVALHRPQPVVIGAHRPERALPQQARLLAGVVERPVRGPRRQDAIAGRLVGATDQIGHVGEAGVGQLEGPVGAGVVADAQVVARAGGQRRPPEAGVVAHHPRHRHQQHAEHQGAQGARRGPRRWRRPAHQPCPEGDGEHRQHQHQPHRPHQPGHAEQHTRRRGAHRRRPPGAADAQRHQRGGAQRQEARFGQGRRAVEHQVRRQRHQPGGHHAGAPTDQAPTEHAHARDGHGAGHDVQAGGRPPHVIGHGRVDHQPPRGGQQRRVAHRVVGGGRARGRAVAATLGEIGGQAHVHRWIVLTHVGSHGHDAPHQAHDHADADHGGEGGIDARRPTKRTAHGRAR